MSHPLALKESTKTNFQTIREAFSDGNACLMSLQDVKTGEPIPTICAISTRPDGETYMIPFAIMIEGNPFKMFKPPFEEN